MGRHRQDVMVRAGGEQGEADMGVGCQVDRPVGGGLQRFLQSRAGRGGQVDNCQAGRDRREDHLLRTVGTVAETAAQGRVAHGQRRQRGFHRLAVEGTREIEDQMLGVGACSSPLMAFQLVQKPHALLAGRKGSHNGGSGGGWSGCPVQTGQQLGTQDRHALLQSIRETARRGVVAELAILRLEVDIQRRQVRQEAVQLVGFRARSIPPVQPCHSQPSSRASPTPECSTRPSAALTAVSRRASPATVPPWKRAAGATSQPSL